MTMTMTATATTTTKRKRMKTRTRTTTMMMTMTMMRTRTRTCGGREHNNQPENMTTYNTEIQMTYDTMTNDIFRLAQ